MLDLFSIQLLLARSIQCLSSDWNRSSLTNKLGPLFMTEVRKNKASTSDFACCFHDHNSVLLLFCQDTPDRLMCPPIQRPKPPLKNLYLDPES
jgi:hypothetical protein